MAETAHDAGVHAAEAALRGGFDPMIALIVLLPLFGALLTFLVGKKMWRGGAMIPIVAVAGSLVLSSLEFFKLLGGEGDYAWSANWFTVGHFDFTAGILVDHLSGLLAALVSLLSLLIVIFSTHYLHEEPNNNLNRYYSVKALFIAGMLGTVLADNFLIMFIFWEIMGLCSYLLIGYWFTKPSAAIAAKKAFLTTRLGDILLMVGIIILFVTFGTLNYREIFANTAMMEANQSLLFWAALLIFGGAVGKSAQFPLDIWLPDAMEGPTTVSALIHAATMVKAGVFLVARSFPLFVLNPETFLVIGVIGGITALYTATMALVATDIKRVLAFSTLSQLGYMFLALGAGGIVYIETHSGVGFTAAMLHLLNHAFFKALLFLGSASVILGMHHHQDMRDMGGLKKRMPTTFWVMLIGSLSIAGIIPLSGFWSKDEVLATAFKAGSYEGVFTLMWVFGVLTAALTAFYMFRMIYLTFAGKPRTEHAEHAHESPAVMTVPLLILAVFAVVSGLWLVVGEGFEAFLTYPYSGFLGEAHHESTSVILQNILTNPLTYLSLGVAAAGILFARARYKGGLPASEVETPTRGLRGLLYNRYYVTQLVYEPLGTYVAYGIARVSSWFDRKGIDGAVNGIADSAQSSGERLRRWQNGDLTTYLASIAIGVAVMIVFVHEVVLRIRW